MPCSHCSASTAAFVRSARVLFKTDGVGAHESVKELINRDGVPISATRSRERTCLPFTCRRARGAMHDRHADCITCARSPLFSPKRDSALNPAAVGGGSRACRSMSLSKEALWRSLNTALAV